MTGKRIGKLTVLRRDESKKGGAAYWICQCDCGNIISVRGQNLRDKKHPTLSCGCISKTSHIRNTSELIGKTFGRLTVLKRDLSKPSGKGKTVYWICKCQCGNIVSVSGESLKKGRTKSCGCLRKQLITKKNTLNLAGKKYGKVTALKNTYHLSSHNSYLWQCKCECGKIFYASAEDLQSGHISSCGCSINSSRGETKIKDILEENHIPYISQYTFSDCRNPKTNYLLRFDFAILNNDNSIKKLIEFDGEQHYKENEHFKSSLKEIQERDNIKNEYCQKHNILLQRIPYWQYHEINLQMLMD